MVKRWAKNLFCLFSLLVFMLIACLWVRSWFAGGLIARWTVWEDVTQNPVMIRRVGYSLGWARGQVGITRYEDSVRVPDSPHTFWFCDLSEGSIRFSGAGYG